MTDTITTSRDDLKTVIGEVLKDAPPTRVRLRGLKRVHVFTLADYGAKGDFSSDAVVDQMIADYDPVGKYKAKVNLDHQQIGRTHGEIESFSRRGRKLIADEITQLSEQLGTEIPEGGWPERSIEIWKGPKWNEGRPYIKAVSFLGVAPPEVKGLERVQFTDESGEVFEAYSDNGEPFEIYTFDEEDIMAGNATDPVKDPQAAGKADESKVTTMGEDKGEVISMAEFNAMKAQTARLEAENRRARVQRRIDALKFQEGGPRVLPAFEENDALLEIFTILERSSETVTFGEGEAKNPAEALAAMFASLPPLVKTTRKVPGGDLPEHGESVSDFSESKLMDDLLKESKGMAEFAEDKDPGGHNRAQWIDTEFLKRKAEAAKAKTAR